MFRKILICHLSKSGALMMKNILARDESFEFMLTQDLDDCVDLTFSFKPHLIILGDTFFDSNVTSFIDKITTEQAPPPCLIIQSGSNTTAIDVATKFADYVPSPFNESVFLGKVNKIFANSLENNRSSTDYRNMHILIAEDSLSYQNVYKEFIEELGCTVTICDNGLDAWNQLCSGLEVDLIVTDIIMPIMDGEEFARLVTSDKKYEDIPIIVSSTIEQLKTLTYLFELGVNDYFTKPFQSEIFTCRLKAHLKTRVLLKREQQFKKELQQFNSVLDVKVKEQTQEIRAANLEVINKLAKVSEYKDQVTGDHILRVRSYTEVLAKNIGYSEEDIEKIGIASIMHDVGKISIPDSIIQKPTKLTADEREIMEKHALYGEELFGDSHYFSYAAKIAGGHHEKWDGSGYPRKLAGENIPLEARIVAIADVFDALLSSRSYKKAFSLDQAVAILIEGKGAHFDPNLLDIFVSLIKKGELDSIFENYPY